MSSTEQKNITQPFVDSCFTFGVLPTLLTKAFDNFELCTDGKPFEQLGATFNLGARLRMSENPIEEVRKLLPVVSGARPTTKLSPLILRLCSDCSTYSGNQGVLRLAESLITRRWGTYVSETPGIKHASNHAPKVISMLAPGAYSNFDRASRTAAKLQFKSESYHLRCAADSIDHISRQPGNSKHGRDLNRWCRQAYVQTGFNVSYHQERRALEHYSNFHPSDIHEFERPPEERQKWFTVKKNGSITLRFYRCRRFTFFKVEYKYGRKGESKLHNPSKRERKGEGNLTLRREHIDELFVLTDRDLEDLRFLLHASSHIQLYYWRRTVDVLNRDLMHKIKYAQAMFWSSYLEVMRICGRRWDLRNKLGVYFDVLQWRYLAGVSGDEFVDHSVIMARKIASKGLRDLPEQSILLGILRNLPMDISIDLLGIYKASIYPEVDPFQVVVDQYKLHYSRHNTEWERGSPEAERFSDTKAYMWYFGVRVLHQRSKVWPGRIRQGVPEKAWHKSYKQRGIPPQDWRESHDVDLTGAVPVADISNEQYMKQQDSACAPPLSRAYKSYGTLMQAPKRHRRKLLYAIQEAEPPDLAQVLSHLDSIGSGLSDGHIDPIEHELEFSVDIVTGSRCERHKDAPRPFYAASPPWGCILSYVDGITRDFLNSVPQSMLGKSTRQKFTDIHTTSIHNIGGTQAFYMSDDKAKYSPRMDPRSQQLPADFFAELFGIPGIKAMGPIMYHNLLYYRVCGHLVSYNSNGTDREGMRGASNTWLEIVAQGLSTRLNRERGRIKGKSIFLSFIDDGLRKFSVDMRGRSPEQIKEQARLVIDDVIFGLKVLGRELSWDKTFISRDLFVILNEIVYDTSHFSSGLKSFVTAGDLELKEVMTAPDYEQLYFGKMRGAHGVGAPLDLCHYVYIFETLLSHYRMGVNLQDNPYVNQLEYRLFCVTPVALGGAGIRSMLQLCCNEVANATKEGIGNLVRLSNDRPVLGSSIQSIMSQDLEPISPIDFMREPEQFHVYSPRLKTQRLAAEVRKSLMNKVGNPMSQNMMLQDDLGMQLLDRLGRTLKATGDVSAEEIRLLYSSTPVAFVDEFIQKLASSNTLSGLLSSDVIYNVRRAVRRDLVTTLGNFRYRCISTFIANEARSTPEQLASISFISK